MNAKRLKRIAAGILRSWTSRIPEDRAAAMARMTVMCDPLGRRSSTEGDLIVEAFCNDRRRGWTAVTLRRADGTLHAAPLSETGTKILEAIVLHMEGHGTIGTSGGIGQGVIATLNATMEAPASATLRAAATMEAERRAPDLSKRLARMLEHHGMPLTAQKALALAERTEGDP